MDTSYELAANLIKLAEWLKSRPEFPVPDNTARLYSLHYGDTDQFRAAVRALGAGVKGEGVIDTYLRFTPTGIPSGTKFDLETSRNGLCRLVRPAQPAVYECDSLLDEVSE